MLAPASGSVALARVSRWVVRINILAAQETGPSYLSCHLLAVAVAVAVVPLSKSSLIEAYYRLIIFLCLLK